MMTSEAIAKKAFHRRHSVTWMIARMILGALERVPRMFGTGWSYKLNFYSLLNIDLEYISWEKPEKLELN